MNVGRCPICHLSYILCECGDDDDNGGKKRPKKEKITRKTK